MKHKVGDKVRIRKDLRIDKEHDEVSVVDEMGTWIGEEVTISKVLAEDNGYGIKEDDGYFLWTDSMFEDAMTNADKIRNMSDEELAEFLCKTAKYGNPYIDMWKQWVKENTL